MLHLAASPEHSFPGSSPYSSGFMFSTPFSSALLPVPFSPLLSLSHTEDESLLLTYSPRSPFKSPEKTTAFEALSPPADRLNPIFLLLSIKHPLLHQSSPLLEMGTIDPVSREDPQPHHDEKDTKTVRGLSQNTSGFHRREIKPTEAARISHWCL